MKNQDPSLWGCYSPKEAQSWKVGNSFERKNEFEFMYKVYSFKDMHIF